MCPVQEAIMTVIAPETVPNIIEALADRSRTLPAQFTQSVRYRMVRALWIEQRSWMALTFIYAAISAAALLLVLRESGLSALSAQALRSVLLGAGVFLVLMEIYYFRQRRRVMTMPLTTALVIRRKDAPHYKGSVPSGAPSLQLRYLADGDERVDITALRYSERAHTVWVGLEGFSSRFEQDVKPGDFVTISYDPLERERVTVVEVETGA
jgi:hypothetical protein